MAVILFLLLLLLAAFAYWISGKDLMTPSLLTIGPFLVCNLFVIMNYGYWGYDIKSKTVLVIFGALAAQLTGETIIRQIMRPKKIMKTPDSTSRIFERVSSPKSISQSLLNLPKWVYIIGGIFSIAISIWYSIQQYCNYLQIVNTMGRMGSMLKTLRDGQLLVSQGIFYVQLADNLILKSSILILSIYASICIFILLYNWLVYRYFRLGLGLFLPIICWLYICTVSTSRIGFAYLICYIVLIYCIILMRIMRIKGLNSKNMKKKIIKLAIWAFLIGVAIFWLLGYLTDKSGGEVKIWSTLSNYIGAPIVCFDLKIDEITLSSMPGMHTFMGLYTILRYLGFDIPYYFVRVDSFCFWNNGASNVYPGMYSYIRDFGYIGMVILQFIIGIITGYIWERIKSKKANYLLIIFYSYFSFGFILSFISSAFFTEILTISNFISMIFLIVFYYLFLKKKLRNQEKSIITY